ncbi:hypothetical protein FDECE_15875 [Fusarium decemcellulare]|nr:hypothetical protein FDECE_15875 [Fusarium decemcellulare]
MEAQLVLDTWPSHVSVLSRVSGEKLGVFHILVITNEIAQIEGGKDESLSGSFSKEPSFCLGITGPAAGFDVARLETTTHRSSDSTLYTATGARTETTSVPQASHSDGRAYRGPGEGGVPVLAITMNLTGMHWSKVDNSGYDVGALPPHWGLQPSLGDNQIIRKNLTETSHRIEAHRTRSKQVAYYANATPLGWESPDLVNHTAPLNIQGGQTLKLASMKAQQTFEVAVFRVDQRGDDRIDQLPLAAFKGIPGF